MTERFVPQTPVDTKTPGKFDPHTGHWRPLTTVEFFQADDIPGSVTDLEIKEGERSTFTNMWDNLLLTLEKRHIIRERVEAQAVWDSFQSPEKRAKALQIPFRTQELSVEPSR